jgi:hypothetical protein
MAGMGSLSRVACYFSNFVDIQDRRTGCDFLDLAQKGASVGCDFRSGETLVLIFYGLGHAVKNYAVIS